MVPASYYLILSGILFTLGTVGVLIRRNALVMFMSVEMMLNAVNLTLVTYSRFLASVDGQVFALLVMAVAAAEVAVGLAIVVSLFRHREVCRNPADVDEMNVLKW